MLSCPPWGHLPLMRILIYPEDFNRILIGCIAALNDGSSTHTHTHGPGGCLFFPSFFVFLVFFWFFLNAHFCSLCRRGTKIISLAYSQISPVWKKSEASHGHSLITNDKLAKTWECSIRGQQNQAVAG